MGWFMSKIYDRFMQPMEEAALQEWRRELLSEAGGSVLELGAGTGLNLPLYPEAVERLVALEPDPHMRSELASRLEAAPADEIEIVEAEAESLPFEDATFDTVVSTLVLCSVDRPVRAMREARRVLREGGRLLFLEHVAARENPGRLKWQRRIEPVWKWVAGNCHLTRRSSEIIRAAGFEIDELQRESMRKALPFVRPSIRGRAHR